MAKQNLLLGVVFLLLAQTAFAHKPYRKSEIDSLHKLEIFKRHAQADEIRRNVVQVHFSADYADSLLTQMEQFHIALNSITNQTKYSFKTEQIEKELQGMQSSIDIITQSANRDSSVVNINNLQMYRGLLKDMEEKLQTWRDVLQEDNDDLQDMTDQMTSFVRDSFTQKVAADSEFANLHLDEMLILNQRWKEAEASTSANLNHINKLQATVSTDYFDVTELENKVDNLLAGSGKKAFQQEQDYIWHLSSPSLDEVRVLTGQSIANRIKILGYYLALNYMDWLYFLLIGIAYFFWVFRNFRRIKNKESGTYQTDLELKYIRPVPVLSTLIFILSLAPYYGLNQPAVYIEIIQLCILVPLTALFWLIWPKKSFVFWCILAVLFILTSCMNAIITPGWPLRLFLLVLNIASLAFGLILVKGDKNMVSGRAVKVTIILYTLLNFLAVIANIAGRLTLAKIFTSAAVIGLTQMIGLFVIVEILIEAFYLQMQSSRISVGMSAKFNFENIRADLYQILTVVSVLLGLIIFFTNIDLHFVMASLLDSVFNTPRKIGSTSFTIGNLLTFGVILYLVSVLQKYVGYFFGETEEDFVGDLDKKESRLVLVRLAIIMAGFFMAIVASGLPVDKVTVVLGALSVGIGLGLQNIVFNLVSGVILIFEKPMQIGDYIEVGDKKGRVQNIGIRSSKLITPDGSEVIVPNGDILSSHMVNWTRSNNHRRTELTFGVEPSSQLQLAKDSIMEELKGNSYVIQGEPVEILVNNLSETSAALTVHVWINSIYKEQEFKSQVLSNIYNRLAAKGIKIV
jgi:small-conductance mechanosensitive channel